MIFLQGAARRESPAGACLELAEQSNIELCVSPEILAEVADVLHRPSVRAKFPALTGQVVAEFIDAVRNFATVIEDVPREFVLERDPKDEPYLNLACRSGAEYLVTRDNDLLDLAVRSSPIGLALRQRFSRLRIVEPFAFLLAVRDRVSAICSCFVRQRGRAGSFISRTLGGNRWHWIWWRGSGTRRETGSC